MKRHLVNNALQAASLAKNPREAMLAAIVFLKSLPTVPEDDFFPHVHLCDLIRARDRFDIELERTIGKDFGRWLIGWATPRELRKLADLLEADRAQQHPHEALLRAYKQALNDLFPQNASVFRKLSKSRISLEAFSVTAPHELEIALRNAPTLGQVRAKFVAMRGEASWPNGKAVDRMNHDRINRRIIVKQFGLPLAKDPNRRPKKLGQKASEKRS